MSSLFKVFVYGTLKKGFANHHLLENAKKGAVQFVAAGQTKETYPLVVGTDACIPFMLPLKGQGQHVHGEIYEVDSDVLQSLDELEEHPLWYRRELCEIVTTSVGTVTCFAYFLTNFTEKFLSLEYLSEFTKEWNHSYNMKLEIRSFVDIMAQSQGR